MRLPRRGQVVGGRYRLTEQLGSGGMRFVFQAEQLGVGNQVAIKFLDPQPSQDESRVKRFLQEAKVALAVAHPGATQLLDVGRDEALRLLYLVFEFVPGEDLRALLRREGRLSFGEAREVALKVAEVLAFAHRRGVVHRDVKPENLRLRRDLSGPHVKVLDFGIARLVQQQGVRLTAEGQIAGTPRYMAPEQVNDGPIDARTDCYALGLVIWEMLAGRPAYDGRNLAHVMWQQVNEPLPALAALLSGAPTDEVDAFLARACAKKAEQRFRSMEALVFALKGLAPASWPPPPLQAGTLPRPQGLQGPTADALTAPELGDAPAPTRRERQLEPPTEPARLAVAPGAKAAPVEQVREPAVEVGSRLPAPGSRKGEPHASHADGRAGPAEAWTVAGAAESSAESRLPHVADSSQQPGVPEPAAKAQPLPADLRATVRTADAERPASPKPAPPTHAAAELLVTVRGTADLAPAKQRRRRWPLVVVGLLLLGWAIAFAVHSAMLHR